VSGAKVMIPMFSLSVVILLVLSFGGYMPYALHFVMISILGILSFVLTSYVTGTVLQPNTSFHNLLT
jgi:membrane protein implicated in regulation of membrane protease activity